jgi:hypothetical protein
MQLLPLGCDFGVIRSFDDIAATCAAAAAAVAALDDGGGGGGNTTGIGKACTGIRNTK